MRISGDKHPLRGSHPEKENQQPAGREDHQHGGIPSLEAWSVLQQLQFDDAGGLFGALNPYSHSSDGGRSVPTSRHAWEVQVTYCGIGPHYSYPVADLLGEWRLAY